MNTWINGRRSTMLDHRDRGVQYGDGLFETMRVRERRPRLLDYHLERMYEGCRRLDIGAPPMRALRRELKSRASLSKEAVLKLIVSRGVGVRGYRPSGKEHCTRIISLYPLPRSAAPPDAARVRICATPLTENALLAGLKTLNRLDSVLARAEWCDRRIWEGLMRDANGHVVCGTMCNLFVRRGSVLATPVLDRCGVAGVMRRWVLEQALSLGLEAIEKRLGWQEIAAADEAFLTNAVAGVVSVEVIGQRRERAAFRERKTAHSLRQRLELV